MGSSAFKRWCERGIYYGIEAVSLACENIRFSSLFAARDVPSGEERGETDVFAGYRFFKSFATDDKDVTRLDMNWKLGQLFPVLHVMLFLHRESPKKYIIWLLW